MNKKKTMPKETFFRLAAFLGMSYKQLAESSGYSYGLIQAVKNGNRPVSKRLEIFIKQRLLLSMNDKAQKEAIRTVIRVCGEAAPENGSPDSES